MQSFTFKRLWKIFFFFFFPQKERVYTPAHRYRWKCKITNLFRCAIEQLFQLLFAAPFMASVKDVDFGFCPWCCAHFGQLTTNAIISFFQVLHRAFLTKKQTKQFLKLKRVFFKSTLLYFSSPLSIDEALNTYSVLLVIISVMDNDEA